MDSGLVVVVWSSGDLARKNSIRISLGPDEVEGHRAHMIAVKRRLSDLSGGPLYSRSFGISISDDVTRPSEQQGA